MPTDGDASTSSADQLPTTGEAPRTTTQRMVGRALAVTALGAAFLAVWFWWIAASLLVLGLSVGAVVVTFSDRHSWWFGLLMSTAAAAVAVRWGLHARKVRTHGTVASARLTL